MARRELLCRPQLSSLQAKICDSIPARFSSREYLNENWEHEYKLLAQFCAVIGLEEGEYKPKPRREYVLIETLKPFSLGDGGDSDDNDYSDDNGDSDDNHR